MKSSTMPVMFTEGDDQSRGNVIFPLDIESSRTYDDYVNNPKCRMIWKRLGLAALVVVGLLTCLSLINLVTSFAATKNPKSPFVDNHGYLVSSNNHDLVATTTSTGKVYELEMMLNLHESSHPFACVEIQVAADMWTSVRHGIASNVALSLQSGPSGNGSQEHGLRLTYQGATKDNSFACIPTADQTHKLCIDFDSNRCDEKDSSKATPDEVFGPAEEDSPEDDDDDDGFENTAADFAADHDIEEAEATDGDDDDDYSTFAEDYDINGNPDQEDGQDGNDDYSTFAEDYEINNQDQDQGQEQDGNDDYTTFAEDYEINNQDQDPGQDGDDYTTFAEDYEIANADQDKEDGQGDDYTSFAEQYEEEKNITNTEEAQGDDDDDFAAFVADYASTMPDDPSEMDDDLVLAVGNNVRRVLAEDIEEVKDCIVYGELGCFKSNRISILYMEA